MNDGGELCPEWLAVDSPAPKCVAELIICLGFVHYRQRCKSLCLSFVIPLPSLQRSRLARMCISWLQSCSNGFQDPPFSFPQRHCQKTTWTIVRAVDRAQCYPSSGALLRNVPDACCMNLISGFHSCYTNSIPLYWCRCYDGTPLNY